MIQAWPAWRTHAQWNIDAPDLQQREAEAIARLDGMAIAGHCGLCERDTSFLRIESAAPWREGLLCDRCRCNARQRAAGIVLLQSLARPHDAQVYATEQASPFYVALKRRLKRDRKSVV